MVETVVLTSINANDLNPRQNRFSFLRNQFQFQLTRERHVLERAHDESLTGLSTWIDRHILEHRPALDGDVEWGKVEAGQSAGLVDDILPAAEVVRRLVAELEEARKRLAAL